MKKVLEKKLRVVSYTHAYVTTDYYDGDPIVQREVREICVKATAWYCSESGTYRLDTVAIIQANGKEYAWVWGRENPFQPLAITMPSVHLAAVPPYATEADIKQDALNRIRLCADAARRACKESKLDMSRISDKKLLDAHERSYIPF